MFALLVGAGVARAGLWDELPLAATMRADLERLSEAALRARADTLRQRLFIDEQTIAIERGEDLELVVGYAAAVELLWERARSPEIAAARRSAGFLLHATGWLAEERGDLRVAIAELGASEDAAGRRLAASIKAARRFGRAAFVAALGDPGTGPIGAVAEAQAGRIALREGEPLAAAQHFMAAAGDDALPRFAVDACEALLTVGSAETTALCARLEERFVATWPASARRFAEVRERVADTLRSNEFVAGERERLGRLEELAGEIARAGRLGRDGAARRLAKVATERFPGDVMSWRLAAEVAVAAGSRADLERALAGAARHGHGEDARLAEAKAVLALGQAVDDALGRSEGGRGRQRLDDATRAWVAGQGGAIGRQLRALVALADEGERGGPALEAALAALMAGELDSTSARLALVIALVRGRWDVDAPRVVAAWRAWAGVRGGEFAALAAAIEVGRALDERDRERLDRALEGLVGDAPEVVLTRLVARRAREVIAGAALPRGGLDADRLTLARLAFAFDEASAEGRAHAQARAFTLATIEVRAGRPAEAAELMREARRFGGDVGLLAGGLAQLVSGDGLGAAELCARGGSGAGLIAQALVTCQAVGGPEAEAARLWGLALAGWDGANLPPHLEAGTARPVHLLRIGVDLRLASGAPLAIAVELVPVLLLVPELSPSLPEVRRRAGR